MATAAIAGCAAVPDQQLALEELRTEIRALAGDLDDIEQSLNGASGQMHQLQQVVDARLNGVDEQLATVLDRPPPVCEFPEIPPADPVRVACEAPAVVMVDDLADKMTVGSLEHIRIIPPSIEIAARIDTGADSNSLSATNLVYLERDGDDWVRFDVQSGEETHTLEREVSRFVRVFQQSDVVGTRRPVVELRVQLGPILGDFEFNLSDRTHLKYSVILGRSMLLDLIVVDVSQEFLQPLPNQEG